MGKTVEHLSQLNTSYEDAKKILQASSNSETRIISSDDLADAENGNATADALLDLKEGDPLVDKLKYAAKGDIQSIIEESMSLIKKNPDQFSVFASYLLVDLIFAVSKLVEKLGGNIKELKPEILQRKFIDEAVSDETRFIKTL